MRARAAGVLAAALAAAAGAGCGPSGGPTDAGGNGGTDGAVNGIDSSAPPPDARFLQLIRAAPFSHLVIEVDSVPGMEPYPESETDLVAGLGTLLDKPGGIDVVEDGALASMGATHAWTFEEVSALAEGFFDLAVAADTIKLHVLMVDGHSADDSASGRILGFAWGYTSLVLFKATIEDICRNGPNGLLAPLVQDRLCKNAELGVWTHESGHLIGLVDNGLPMVAGHRDPDPAHGPHDASDQCVMYWATEGESFVDTLRARILGGDDTTLGFDQACLDDVAAVR
jgi:hypothetical protein